MPPVHSPLSQLCSPRAATLVAMTALVLVAAWVFWRRDRGEATPVTPGLASTQVMPARLGSSGAVSTPLSASQVQRGIESARASVEQDPSDAASWAMLAHTYEMAGQFDEAVKAYERLVTLRPDDAQAYADYADAMGIAQGGTLGGDAARLIAKALQLDPRNPKGLVLGGKEAFARRDYATSMAMWQRALAATQDPTLRHTLETSIAESRALLDPVASGAASAPFVSGRITVSRALKHRVGADDAVFVFARPAVGSRMPVALLRRKGRDLPLDFALDDTLALVPQARLSQLREVMVGVHVSRRGDTIPVAGDLVGEIGPVQVGSTGLALRIDHVHP